MKVLHFCKLVNGSLLLCSQYHHNITSITTAATICFPFFTVIPSSNVSNITEAEHISTDVSSSTLALDRTTEDPEVIAPTVSRAPPAIPHTPTSVKTLASVVAMLITRTVNHA